MALMHYGYIRRGDSDFPGTAIVCLEDLAARGMRHLGQDSLKNVGRLKKNIQYCEMKSRFTSSQGSPAYVRDLYAYATHLVGFR